MAKSEVEFLRAELAAIEEENTRMREGLKKLADPDNWDQHELSYAWYWWGGADDENPLKLAQDTLKEADRLRNREHEEIQGEE